MKPKLTILVIAVSLFTNVMAQENNVWFDIDFSSKEWLNHFKNAGYNFQVTSPGEAINFRPGASYVLNNVNGFNFNANAYRESSPITSVCEREFEYGIRLRQNADTYIELPSVKSAGKITLYVQNPNETSPGQENPESKWNHLKLQIKTGKTWEDLHEWTIETLPELKLKGEYDKELTFDININRPVKIRLFRNEARFLKVFGIRLEKCDDTASSGL